MKLTLYCRRSPKNPTKLVMWTRAEEEPCFDTPRIINLMGDIRRQLDDTIASCERDGAVVSTYPDKRKRGVEWRG